MLSTKDTTPIDFIISRFEHSVSKTWPSPCLWPPFNPYNKHKKSALLWLCLILRRLSLVVNGEILIRKYTTCSPLYFRNSTPAAEDWPQPLKWVPLLSSNGCISNSENAFCFRYQLSCLASFWQKVDKFFIFHKTFFIFSWWDFKNNEYIKLNKQFSANTFVSVIGVERI